MSVNGAASAKIYTSSFSIDAADLGVDGGLGILAVSYTSKPGNSIPKRDGSPVGIGG